MRIKAERTKADDIRQSMRQKRRQLGPARRQRHARAALGLLMQSGLLDGRQHIGVYLDFDGEMPTGALIKALRGKNKQLYAPLIDDSSISFQPLRLIAPSTRNRFSITEPPRRAIGIAAQQLDLVFMPLTAFDKSGRRLGMGGGYYDRCFAFKRRRPAGKPLLIGWAHECQRTSLFTLPQHPWDVRLDLVVSECSLVQVKA